MFEAVVVSRTENPQRSCWSAMHVCYSEDRFHPDSAPEEEKAGESLVKHCLKFGHWSVVEFASMAVLYHGFPHSVPMQVRTHRHLSCQVQSMRYTGERIIKAADGEFPIDDVFYLRTPGVYTDRKGQRYHYTDLERYKDCQHLTKAAQFYKHLRCDIGLSEEHARDFIPSGYQQSFIVSANLRAWLHVLDLRYKSDAQLECQHWASITWNLVKEWVPQVAEFYEKTRLNKARLSP